MRDNIVLIGMPGSGKSTVGVVLAKILGYQFVDMDLVIQKKMNKRLFELIEEYGNEGFMAIEDRINAEFEGEKTVIAPGGSVVLGKEAMRHYKDIATVVYLKLSYEELESRLGNLEERGVVLEPGSDLRHLYEYRAPFYEQYADITIEEHGEGISQTAGRIAKLFLAG